MRNMPKARQRGLIIQELSDEILIYDEARNRAHCLNLTAAKVWKHCDGNTTVQAACRSLSLDFGTPVDEQVVWHAVEQFARDHLLEEQVKLPTSSTKVMNRRQMALRLGFVAVAVPLVTSIFAPTAAQAGGSPPNCITPGQPCTASAQCCSQLCSGGTCA